MKMKKIVISMMIVFMVTGCTVKDSDSQSVNETPGGIQFTDLTGEYLGQTPPGAIPVLFAPGVISVNNHFEHSGAVFSPDKTEVYWSAKPDGDNVFHIYFMKRIDNRWTTPQMLSFTENYDGNRHAFSPDGRKLYFETIRNPVGGPILVVERSGDGWGDPAPLPPVINATGGERMFCLTENGSLYFARGGSPTGDEEVLVSRFVNGQFVEPEPLGPNVNSPLTEAYIFVVPDERYMVIESIDQGSYAGLYISYREADGSWSERVELSFGWARFPVISPDGLYLFFMGTGGIYWVSTSFVEDLKPDHIP